MIVATMRDLMMIVESEDSGTTFVDHLQDAVEASGAGYHYEEGGCWGMALALYDAFKALGAQPQFMLELPVKQSSTGFIHALVMVDGRLYDHTGMVISAYDVRGDAIAAAEIVQAAQTWDHDED